MQKCLEPENIGTAEGNDLGAVLLYGGHGFPDRPLDRFGGLAAQGLVTLLVDGALILIARPAVIKVDVADGNRYNSLFISLVADVADEKGESLQEKVNMNEREVFQI